MAQGETRQMVEEAQELQPVLWQAVLDRLDRTGQQLFVLYGLLFIYEKLVSGQMSPGPAIDLAEIRQTMKKTLNQARLEVARLSLIERHADESASGPGGTRTHDPHNAMGE